MPTSEEYFAQSIKKLRKTLGYTQQELADVIGVRKTTICNYESGYARPTINTLQHIMNCFGLPASYFIPDEKLRNKVYQNIFGVTIPYFEPKNILGLSTKNRTMMDSPLTLPLQTNLPKTGYIATTAPDNSMNMCNISKGNIVVINTEKDLYDQCIFAAISSNKLIIRKYHNNQSGTFMSCESTRVPAGLSFDEMPKENFCYLGIVTKIISDI